MKNEIAEHRDFVLRQILQGLGIPRELIANDPPTQRSLEIVASEGFQLEAADAGSDVPKFTMVAYTGGGLPQAWAAYPIVVEISSMIVPDHDIPVLYAHDPMKIVGHGRASVFASKVKLAGLVSGVGPEAQEVRATSKNGFPWQASMRGPIGELAFVDRGQSVKVNGKTFQGPVYVARYFALKEVSFVSLGADDNTSAAVSASVNHGVKNMTFEQWLEAQGFTGELSDGQKAILKAAYDAEQTPKPPVIPAPQNPAPNLLASGGGGNPPSVPNSEEIIAQMRRDAAAEQTRLQKLQTLCSGHPEIHAKAIGEGWTTERAELEVLRANRPSTPAVHVPNHQATPNVLTAALCIAGKLESVEQQFDDQTLQAAHTQFRRGIGLQEFFLLAAWEGGYTGRNFRNDHKGVLQAAFSTSQFASILSNVANKFLLEGFNFVEQAWRMIAAIRPVNDFKTVTSHRMLSGGRFEKVGPSGELKSASLSDQQYSNKADTYGEILTITRQDQINDDLGALSDRPKMIGRDGGLKFNDVFWTEFMDNATFFQEADGNYFAGGSSALSIDSLSQAEQLMMDQNGADGKPLGLNPKVLLVATSRGALGSQLMKSAEIRDTTANAKTPIANPHAGKFEVAISRYLGNASYTGNSQKAWYLLGAPEDEAVIEAAFLNGQDTPIIESADADFDTLGTKMRGYFDFGVRKREKRAGVKAKGEA